MKPCGLWKAPLIGHKVRAFFSFSLIITFRQSKILTGTAGDNLTQVSVLIS